MSPLLDQEAEDAHWMQLAWGQAREAAGAGEVPVGAVVVRNGQLLATGRNAPIASTDPTAHAEVVALRAAAQILGNYRLEDCTLYVTLEPCAMCSGAMLHARLSRVVFGAADAKTGTAGSVLNLFGHPTLNHHTRVQGGVLASECAQLLKDFFAPRRANRNPLRDDALRTPERRFTALPDWHWPMQQWAQLPMLAGLHMRGVDQSATGTPTCHVLCLHPEAGWSYTFRHLIPPFLAEGARVLAPDLVGFGQSDKPKKDAFHTVAWHAQALSAWMEAQGLAHVVCVLPRQGGMARVGAELLTIAPNLFQAVVWLDGSTITHGHPDGDTQHHLLAAYDAPFPDRGYKAAPRAFAHWGAGFEADSARINMPAVTCHMSDLDTRTNAKKVAASVLNRFVPPTSA